MKGVKQNLPPGTLIYTGDYKNQKTYMDLLSYNSGSSDFRVVEQLPEAAMEAEETEGNMVSWLRIIGLNDINLFRELGERYDLSPLVLEDILHVSQRSKIESHRHFMFSVFKMVYFEDGKVKHEHIAILLLKNLVITFQETDNEIFNTLREQISKNDSAIRKMGQDYLFYSIVDNLIDEHYEVMNYIQEQFDEIETLVLDKDNNVLDELYRLRKELLALKASVFPLNEMIQSLITVPQSYISKEVIIFFGDIRDHLSHISDLILVYRELVNSLFDMLMSNVNNNTNKIMTTLTVFSAIFIPLSFLAGVFGMNFKFIPGLEDPNGFIYITGVFILVAAGMITFLKTRKWL